MKIVRVAAKNFKSFKDIDIHLGDLNLIIGPNSAGKSNFIQVLKFYCDAINFGLEDAISLQGGTGYLRNNNLIDNNISEFIFEFDLIKKSFSNLMLFRDNLMINHIESKFSLKFNKRGEGFSLLSESIKVKFEEYADESQDSEKRDYFDMTLERNKSSKHIKVNVTGGEEKEKIIKEILPPIGLVGNLLNKDQLMIKYISLFLGIRRFINESFTIFDFDPKVLKKSSSVSAKYNLEEDGSNLSICLNTVLKKSKNKKVFINQLQDMLPFINGILTEKTLDKTMLFKIKEKYSDSKYFPASLMSDGTVNIVAVILALYFDDRELVVFEEPERNIHPGLLSKLLDKFYEMSTEKQIIITTHNPEVIKHVKKEDIIFVKRNSGGFTEGKRINQIKDIHKFLDEEIGVDELYVDDILGGLF